VDDGAIEKFNFLVAISGFRSAIMLLCYIKALSKIGWLRVLGIFEASTFWVTDWADKFLLVCKKKTRNSNFNIKILRFKYIPINLVRQAWSVGSDAYPCKSLITWIKFTVIKTLSRIASDPGNPKRFLLLVDRDEELTKSCQRENLIQSPGTKFCKKSL